MIHGLDGLRDLTFLSVIFRVLLTLLVGGLLGFDRGRKKRAAGFRTYMLVCLGAALVMMTNQYVYLLFGGTDPVRMGAQVISGIGFLGAGTILVTNRNRIKGTTTAAGLWTAACCGLAIGIGFYEGALVGGLAILLIMTLMGKLDFYINKHSQQMDLYLEFSGEARFSQFLEFVRANKMEIMDIQVQKTQLAQESGYSVVIGIEIGRYGGNHADVIALLSEAPGVQSIEEL